MKPRDMALAARRACRVLARRDGGLRARILERYAAALRARRDEILAANRRDLRAAEEAQARGELSAALAARLVLSRRKLDTLAEGIEAIAAAEDPLGRTLRHTELAPGLELWQKTVPLGVLLVIFESRPDALPQIASLAIRAGNGLLLKGGKEARHSNEVLHRLLVESWGDEVPPGLVGLVGSRDEVADLLALDDVIDLVIPRGSGRLVRSIQQQTRIPVLGHAEGVCHLYVDRAADLDMAVALALDSKTDYPAACNAMETLLVHRAWVESGGLARLAAALRDAEVRLFRGPSTPLDAPPAPSLRHEYGDLACTVAMVDSVEEAIDHINEYGSHHTDAIVTDDAVAAQRFLDGVDSACVFHNASTRFADGYRFGLGAEVGISTGRIHARGPVGLDGLVTTTWIVRGQGDRVADFSSGARRFTHRRLDG